MKKILTGLITTALATFHVAATNITINNPDIDSQILSDGAFTPKNIQGWATVSGSAGIYNPPESVFYGEAGSGSHGNTIYMNGDSIVTQTLNTNLQVNTNYTLSFDVGDRLDTTMPNYTVSIKAAGNTIFNATNPVFPSNGEFAQVNLSFSTGNNSFADNPIVIEISASGNGQVNLDNFVMTEALGTPSSGSKFGEWQHPDMDGTSFSVNTVYFAETDGFITYYNSGSCGNNTDQIRITDNEVAASDDAWVSRVQEYGGMTVPVKKGQYWRVQRYRSGPNCTARIGFLPLL
ncbi:MAG: hypothetical protein ACFHVJ_16400 [Aestuariibacter sp.]